MFGLTVRSAACVALLTALLAAALLVFPVLGVNGTTNGTTDGTTEVHVVKYADDRSTILNETTVDYHWMEANLPICGDGVTRYYHQGPVFEGVWEKEHPDDPYDGWNPAEDIKISILYKGDFGAVMGTNLEDLCNYIGGASDGDTITVCARDGYTASFPYSIIYDPDPRQGPAVLCWYSGNGSGPDMQEGKEQGQGYPDTGYIAGMRMIFFADTSTNPWGWHVFGNNDMKECWDEENWNYGGQYPSAAGTSPMWVDEVRIYSQESPESPVADFTASTTAGTNPLTVAFTDTSDGYPTSWSWDFGDGETSDERNPVHTYTAVGAYTVSLTVANTVGSDTMEKTDFIGVAEPGTTVPVADFSAAAVWGTAPFVVSFTDTSTGDPIAWSWDFGDGAASDEQNPTHTYSAAGTYTVNLTASNLLGSNTAVKSGYITVASSSGGSDDDSSGASAATANTTTPTANATDQAGSQHLTVPFEGLDIREIYVSGQFDPAFLNFSCEKITLPSTVTAAPGEVYAYYNITQHDGPATFDSILIRFTVPETWLQENEIGSGGLFLYRYDDGWDPLIASKTGIDNGSVVYESSVPGFSLFAISGRQGVSSDIMTVAPMQINASMISTTSTESPVDAKDDGSVNWPLIGVAAILLCAAAGAAVWWYVRRDRASGDAEGKNDDEQ